MLSGRGQRPISFLDGFKYMKLVCFVSAFAKFVCLKVCFWVLWGLDANTSNRLIFEAVRYIEATKKASF